MISLSLAKSLEPQHQRRFGVVSPPNLLALGREICSGVWSPIVWKDGVRARSAFESSEYLTLDFDSGAPLAEVRDELRAAGLTFLVGTTKSHQKEKKTAAGVLSPACDRYRVVIRALTTIRERERYEYNLKELAEAFGADESCADGARFFYPCTEIVAIGDGRGLGWRGYADDYVPEAERFAVRRARVQKMGERGIIASWANMILDGRSRAPEGDRHRTCYRLGAHFAMLGLSDELVEQHVARLLKTSVAAIGEMDVRRAVENGRRAENGQGR